MNMSAPNIAELIKVRNSLLFGQRELYVSAATNINMRYRELLKNDFGLILVKNCAWDVADSIVCQYFDAQDFYISTQQMAERIINFSYDNETDLLMSNSTIRKMMYESKNGESLLNDIADKSQKAQQKLFQKEKYVTKSKI